MEFEPSDMPSVMAAIRHGYGEAEKRGHAASTGYRFGCCHFTFQNEWDDPCLIAGSIEGDKILNALYATLTRA
ncbi:hypothetical protein FJQ54_13850 [Sandaracinobacter neustonicus]|uniref:Uncharacterized protein n=1 Tax=Sandaracinobacter neustonicus TaxID=1715348 RepID=A0A501XG90_9SPHN|nr:hypothetical protein [Sandaracinobacter neustonicus]TPE59556.1 hypothetical protein FJQ54_13850 [Sandaracinobacter neustonicus]